MTSPDHDAATATAHAVAEALDALRAADRRLGLALGSLVWSGPAGDRWAAALDSTRSRVRSRCNDLDEVAASVVRLEPAAGPGGFTARVIQDLLP